MVINFCGFRRRVSPNGSSEKASENEKNGVINKLMGVMKIRKRPEKVEEVQLCMDKVITLEDLIVSSPALNMSESPMQKQSSRKIHPSFDGELKQLNLPISTTNQPKKGQSKSSKSKKVSFRSPEVADVFVLHHSPEIDK